METTRAIVTAGCLGLLMVGIGGAKPTCGSPFRYSMAGTNLTSTIDTNEDGTPGGVATAAGKSTLGPIRLQGVNEFILDTIIGSCVLPDGSQGFEFEQIVGAFVFQVRSGDLLTAEVVDGTFCGQCPDPGCIGRVTNRWQITGGTGNFAGASGFFEQEAISNQLLSSPTGGFNTFVAEAEGEIHFPAAE